MAKPTAIPAIAPADSECDFADGLTAVVSEGFCVPVLLVLLHAVIGGGKV